MLPYTKFHLKKSIHYRVLTVCIKSSLSYHTITPTKLFAIINKPKKKKNLLWLSWARHTWYNLLSVIYMIFCMVCCNYTWVSLSQPRTMTSNFSQHQKESIFYCRIIFVIISYYNMINNLKVISNFPCKDWFDVKHAAD